MPQIHAERNEDSGQVIHTSRIPESHITQPRTTDPQAGVGPAHLLKVQQVFFLAMMYRQMMEQFTIWT
jgi:hypothetical protein